MYLNCHTYFSLRYGTASPAELVDTAVRYGIKALALTDINNVSCAVEFLRRCRAAGIRATVGVDFRDADGKRLYIGLARNRTGFEALNRLLSRVSLNGRALPLLAPELPGTWVIYDRLVKPLRAFRSNELLGVRPAYVHRLHSSEVRRFPDKLVVLQSASFLSKADYATHRLLRGVDHNTLPASLPPHVFAQPGDLLLPPETLARFYVQFPRVLRNTRLVLDSCDFTFEQGLGINRRSFSGSKASDMVLLRKLAVNGCRQRYGVRYEAALARMERELLLIERQDFAAYFLITWDIVRYAHSMGYRHVGRGSGANSLVAYCIRVTDVDPLELDLYFERFINAYRTSPPDFDIDFSWDERDDVTDYVFKRYGQEHTALLATYSTFKRRSSIRAMAKALGVPLGVVERILRDPTTPKEVAPELFHYARKIEGFPSHLSIHAGGILITEKPIFQHTALHLMPKGFPITHVDMYHAEELGFHKYDVLSQRGLGHLKSAVDMIYRNRGERVDIYDISKIKTDPRVRAQLKTGRCLGCFYIESPAMRTLLGKLGCEDYRHLVAASSIIRPGVAQSGMMKTYIERFRDPTKIESLHPVFDEHLGETFGIMVYQEDVMKIVHHFAGLALDESDILRRIMTGKKYAGDTFERLRRKFFDNCRLRGHDEALSREVWRQIESFSGYSFCKAHSASFAVESMQSLYLKTHYPLEFMVGVINNFGGFYSTEFYVHEARMAGAVIHAPCVNESSYLTDLKGRELYLGFVHVKGLQQQLAHRLVHQRAADGPFRDLEDFVRRVRVGPGQLDLLIRVGAFRSSGREKAELFYEKDHLLGGPRPTPAGRPQPKAPTLFGYIPTSYELDDLPAPHPLPVDPKYRRAPADERDRRVSETGGAERRAALDGPRQARLAAARDEIELLGFPLCSPFELLEERPGSEDLIAAQLEYHEGRIVRIDGYFVCRKEVRTKNNKRMAFGTWLDRAGEYFDTVHFPNFYARFPFHHRGIYRIEGKVSVDFGVYAVEVLKVTRRGV